MKTQGYLFYLYFILICLTLVTLNSLPQCDAIVNLAGQHILDMRKLWTEKYKQEVIQSRVGNKMILLSFLNINVSKQKPQNG